MWAEVGSKQHESAVFPGPQHRCILPPPPGVEAAECFETVHRRERDRETLSASPVCLSLTHFKQKYVSLSLALASLRTVLPEKAFVEIITKKSTIQEK